jgi:hypothetical protein
MISIKSQDNIVIGDMRGWRGWLAFFTADDKRGALYIPEAGSQIIMIKREITGTPYLIPD